MKTTYWLVAAAAVAAAGVTMYARLAANDPPLPKVPLVAEVAAADVPRLALPPVVLPPDEPLVMPTEPAAAPLPVPNPDPTPAPVAPIVPASASEPLVPLAPPTTPALPLLPAAPTAPVVPPVTSDPPLVPLLPPAPVVSNPVPAKSEAPIPSVAPPAVPLLPPAPPVPAAPAPAPVLQPPVPAKPVPVPPASADSRPHVPAEPLAGVGKYVVLKDDKLIEGGVSTSGDTVVVRQGALDRPFPKSQVQFVAAGRDEVYQFMLAKVPPTDPAARLRVARWCMFSGLREQALTEAREVQKLQPSNVSAADLARYRAGAADLARSLELSLQQFPPEGDAAKMVAPTAPTFPAELSAPVRPISPAALDPEPDVTPEAALWFGTRVQPFLANQCAECHAKPDHAGKFKLVRVNPTDAGPQATRTNLRAVAEQIRKDDPAVSPFLMKALSAHGGMKLPAVVGRQAAVYQTLEAWTALAVGTPGAAHAVPAQPVPVPAPVAPVPQPPAPPVTDPVLPPVPPVLLLPVLPAPVPTAADPLLPLPVPFVPAPPVVPRAPVVPVVPPSSAPPAIPLADPLAPILPPAPPPAPKPIPAAPPFIPPAAVGAQPMPALPPIPPAPVGGTQFGATVPPKPPVTGPTGGDEFDPAVFNQTVPGK